MHGLARHGRGLRGQAAQGKRAAPTASQSMPIHGPANAAGCAVQLGAQQPHASPASRAGRLRSCVCAAQPASGGSQLWTPGADESRGGLGGRGGRPTGALETGLPGGGWERRFGAPDPCTRSWRWPRPPATLLPPVGGVPLTHLNTRECKLNPNPANRHHPGTRPQRSGAHRECAACSM
jgi:hypothetical protein